MKNKIHIHHIVVMYIIHSLKSFVHITNFQFWNNFVPSTDEIDG